MKQYKLIKAYKATETLSRNDKLPASTLWGLYNLRKKLFPHWEFQSEREEAMKKKYTQYADAEGNIRGEYYTDFVAELTELAEMDKDVEIGDKMKFVVKDDIGLTVDMMESLEDFVEFVFE